VHASPGVVDAISVLEADEIRVVEATAAYLIERQRADDLPSTLDLDEVAAAYDDYIDDIRMRLAR
jgi:hypothetical protein